MTFTRARVMREERIGDDWTYTVSGGGQGRKYSVAGLIFDWNGRHTINIRLPHGKDAECVTVGDMEKDKASIAAVEHTIRQWLEQLRSELPFDQFKYPELQGWKG